MKIPDKYKQFPIEKSHSGREFQKIGVERVPDSEKWVNGGYKYQWHHTVRWVDTGEKTVMATKYSRRPEH